jgi:hypothetical protein
MTLTIRPVVPEEERMSREDKMRLRAAAFRVTRLYPGPIGALVAREILAWEEFGFKLGSDSIIAAAVDQILKAEIAGNIE